MKKQLAKGFTMLMLIMAVALVTAVVSANGQSLNSRASVPFDFIVGDKVLPAGEYTVRSTSSNGEAVRVGNTSSTQSAMRLTMQASGTSTTAKLVFHRHGQRYFLAEVWKAGTGEGRRLVKSQQERAIEKEEAKIASQGGTRSTSETIAITLN